MIERIANQSVPIRLGYAGENEVLRVGFNLSQFMEMFPGGHPLLLVKRPNDESAYPVTLNVVDKIGWWTVTSTDTEFPGYGYCQIHWYAEKQLAKTERYMFFVNQALSADGRPPPEAAEQWYDDFIKTLGELESLKTEDKTSIVAAINELFNLFQNWQVPIASETRLGGIIASDSIFVDEDGTAHAVATELAPSMYATEKEVDEMLTEVFGQ